MWPFKPKKYTEVQMIRWTLDIQEADRYSPLSTYSDDKKKKFRLMRELKCETHWCSDKSWYFDTEEECQKFIQENVDYPKIMVVQREVK